MPIQWLCLSKKIPDYAPDYVQRRRHSTEGFQPSQNIIEKWWIYSFVYLLATKPMNKWSKASGQSSEGLWVENRAEI